MWLTLVPALAFAQTEIRVFVGGAVTEPVKAAGAAFTRTTRNTFVHVSDTTGALQKRLASGEKADVVVLAAPGMEALQKASLVAAGSRVDLARALIGVAVGSLRPDLAHPEHVSVVKIRDGEFIRVRGSDKEVADKLARAA
jgi:ABC-type molybdate transport system substrate-binding protein